MTGTGDLTAFLNARLDEDERYLKSNKHHLWTQRPFREVAAKRVILALHASRHECPGDEGYAWYGDDEAPWCQTIRAAVTVYSDHPAYETGWKP